MLYSDISLVRSFLARVKIRAYSLNGGVMTEARKNTNRYGG